MGHSQTITYDASNLPTNVGNLDIGGTSYDITVDWTGGSSSAAFSFSTQADAETAIQSLASALNTDLSDGPPPNGPPADGSLLSFAYDTSTDPFTGGSSVTAATIEFDDVTGTWQFLDTGGTQGETGFSTRADGSPTAPEFGFGDASPSDPSQPVPEPESILIWSLLLLVLGWVYRHEQQRRRNEFSPSSLGR